GIELVAEPVPRFFVLRVKWVADGFEKAVVAGHTAAVFGWAMAFAIHTNGVGLACLGKQPFLHDDRMIPAVAEVVSVDSLGANLPEHLEELNIVRVVYLRQIVIWYSESP